MERNNKTPLPFLLLALLCVCVCVCVCAVGDENCPSVPDNKLTELTCHSDFDQTITCLWSSTSASDQTGNVCRIRAERKSKWTNYHSSCTLEPVDASRPTLKKCLLFFKKPARFLTDHDLSINLSCEPGKQTLSLSFKPACHIKLLPPPRPDVNFTTVSWFPQVTEHEVIGRYSSQLQWKREDQSWMDPSVLKNTLTADGEWNVTRELDEERLMRGERYEARVRVKAVQDDMKSIWSDWSPVASWESAVGGTKERPSDLHVGVLATVAAAAAFAVFLVVIRFKTDKTTWVYMVKRIRGPPLPNPAKSFLQDGNFLNRSPHFPDKSFHSLFKPVEVVSVEVTSAVDAVAPLGLEAALLEKMRSEISYESTSSNFSNPSYSHLCPPPPPLPVSSLTAGSLAPCAADTPYGPVGGHAEKAEQEARGKEVEIRLLLSKGGKGSESMPMVSDYERAEKIQVERARLQSLDSGVCSGEEVSQESLEADSINTVEGEEESEEVSEGGSSKQVDFQKLFGGGGGVFHKASIQVCSGYERVETPQPDGPELLSMDSGVSGVGEEQVSQEDVDQSSESTCLLSPPLPPPCSSSPGFTPLFTPRPLDLCGSELSPALPGHFLERIALMSTSRSVEPSGDGYM